MPHRPWLQALGHRHRQQQVRSPHLLLYLKRMEPNRRL
jgi:hypothetical protein